MKASMGLSKSTSEKLANSSTGHKIGEGLRKIRQIRRSDLRPSVLAERGMSLVRNNKIDRYAAIGGGAAIGLNMLAGTYRGEVSYDKEQEQSHIDIYTKEAFAKGEHLSKASQFGIKNQQDLADKGIDNKNSSIMREISFS